MTGKLFKKSIIEFSTLLLALGQVSAHRPGSLGEQATGGVIEQCQFPGVDGLFVTKEKYPYSNASRACESYGGSLADITNQNYLLGADMVLTCIGPNNKAWIGSWDYRDINSDPEDGVYDCLGLAVGNIGPGGGVDKSCTGVTPVLCQNHPSAVQHNSEYSMPAWSHSVGADPTAAAAQREIDEANARIYPVLYPNFDGGIYRPAVPVYGEEEEEEKGNPVFYPSPTGGVWANNNPVYENPRKQYNGQYNAPVGYNYGGAYGYGSNAYPYGYPYRYPNQHGAEDCETVTVNGVVTTITHDSTSSATVVI